MNPQWLDKYLTHGYSVSVCWMREWMNNVTTTATTAHTSSSTHLEGLPSSLSAGNACKSVSRNTNVLFLFLIKASLFLQAAPSTGDPRTRVKSKVPIIVQVAIRLWDGDPSRLLIGNPNLLHPTQPQQKTTLPQRYTKQSSPELHLCSGEESGARDVDFLLWTHAARGPTVRKGSLSSGHGLWQHLWPLSWLWRSKLTIANNLPGTLGPNLASPSISGNWDSGTLKDSPENTEPVEAELWGEPSVPVEKGDQGSKKQEKWHWSSISSSNTWLEVDTPSPH